MLRYRDQYSVLDSVWGLNKETSEIVGIRILYFDVQMYRPFTIELLRGEADQREMHYATILERAADAHLAYQLFESYKEMFMEGTIELDPKDHPFIAKYIREKELARRRYQPGASWREGYGMPPVIWSSSIMRYFDKSKVATTLVWGVLLAGATIFGWTVW